MPKWLDLPLSIFALSLFTQALGAWIGAALRRWRALDDQTRDDFRIVGSSTLTLLSLIVGFTFSMAIDRYDQRMSYETEEANAIRAQYDRTGLLRPADAARLRALILNYLDERVAFYVTKSERQLRQIDSETTRLQADMWSVVEASVTAQPSPIGAVVASGMTNVLDAKGYAQAAWANRIPVEAWGLMAAIAVCGNMLVGYGARNLRSRSPLVLVLPLILSVTFFLIADIDSPRSALVQVTPQNLIALSEALHAMPVEP